MVDEGVFGPDGEGDVGFDVGEGLDGAGGDLRVVENLVLVGGEGGLGAGDGGAAGDVEVAVVGVLVTLGGSEV